MPRATIHATRCTPDGRSAPIELYYERFGDEAAAPLGCLLLVQGLGGQCTMWHAEFCEQLVQRGFWVIRYDNRDIGLSTQLDALDAGNVLVKGWTALLRGPGKIEAAYTAADMGADAVALLHSLGVRRAHICGTSLGGFIAQAACLHQPSRFLSLTSIASSPDYAGSPSDPELQRTSIRMQLKMAAAPPEDAAAKMAHVLEFFEQTAGSAFEREHSRSQLELADARAETPEGAVRQLVAILAAAPRTARLSAMRLGDGGGACWRGAGGCSVSVARAHVVQRGGRDVAMYVLSMSREQPGLAKGEAGGQLRSEWSVERRYNEFDLLRAAVEKALGPKSRRFLPPFPPKVWSDSSDDELVRQRSYWTGKHSLLAWLRAVLGSEVTARLNDVVSFVGMGHAEVPSTPSRLNGATNGRAWVGWLQTQRDGDWPGPTLLPSPVCVIHGDADEVIPPDHGDATARAISGAQLEVLPGVGHDGVTFGRQEWPAIIGGIVAAARRSEEASPRPRTISGADIGLEASGSAGFYDRATV